MADSQKIEHRPYESAAGPGLPLGAGLTSGNSDRPAAFATGMLDDPALRGLIEQVVRAEPARLSGGVTSLPTATPTGVGRAQVQCLAPLLQQAILEAFRLGLDLGTKIASGQVGGSEPVEATLTHARPAGQAATPAQGSTAGPPAPSARPGHETRHGSQPPDAAANEGALSAESGTAPWLVNGQVTLLVSPFGGFAEVQRFLREVGRIPRIYEVKPKRFSGGRLYVILATDYPDAGGLADVLETELAPYQPKRRSIQRDLIELVLRPTASAPSAGSVA